MAIVPLGQTSVFDWQQQAADALVARIIAANMTERASTPQATQAIEPAGYPWRLVSRS
jgi:hypothetical protein